MLPEITVHVSRQRKTRATWKDEVRAKTEPKPAWEKARDMQTLQCSAIDRATQAKEDRKHRRQGMRQRRSAA